MGAVAIKPEDVPPATAGLNCQNNDTKALFEVLLCREERGRALTDAGRDLDLPLREAFAIIAPGIDDAHTARPPAA